MSDRVLVSQRVVTPGGIRPAALFIKNGVIQHIGAPSEATGKAVRDVGDLAILPGLVDVHVHINEPGRTHWEGFETATRAAAAGGVTTLVDMPLNSAPVTTTVAALEEKRNAARGKCLVDVGFHGGLIPGNTADIEPLIRAGVLGIKAFLVHSGIDDFPNAGLDDLHAALPILARHNVPLLVHAEWDSEDPAPIAQGTHAYADYAASRPQAWETRAIEKLLALWEAQPGCRLHIVHLAASQAVPLLARARANHAPVTVETAPHYLFFEAENVPDRDTRFKCAPPIRDHVNREGLWEALSSGVIDLIATDHSPCPPEMKGQEQGDFGAAWGGIASLQSGLSAVWTEAVRRGFGLGDVAHWMSTAPARSVGLTGRKGAIEPGNDADLIVFDPDAETTVSTNGLRYRHKVTPYEGYILRGLVRQTYLRGEQIYEDSTFLLPAPTGKLLDRGGTATP